MIPVPPYPVDPQPRTCIQVDGGAADCEPDADISRVISAEGDHNIAYFARDLAGNENSGQADPQYPARRTTRPKQRRGADRQDGAAGRVPGARRPTTRQRSSSTPSMRSRALAEGRSSSARPDRTARGAVSRPRSRERTSSLAFPTTSSPAAMSSAPRSPIELATPARPIAARTARRWSRSCR